MRVLRQPFYIRYQKDIVYHQYNISSYVPEKSMYSNRCCDRDFDHLISVNLRINLPLVMIFSNLLVVYLKQFLNNFFLTRLTYEYQFRWKTSKKTISSFFFPINKFLLDEFYFKNFIFHPLPGGESLTARYYCNWNTEIRPVH